MDRQLHHRRPDGRDRGRISVFVAAVMPVMLLFIALMWDASGYLRALHRADNIANEAARAAGQAINTARGERAGIVVDPAAAEQAAAVPGRRGGDRARYGSVRTVGRWGDVVVPYEPVPWRVRVRELHRRG